MLAIILLGAAIGTLIWKEKSRPGEPVIVTGVVLLRDNDPNGQTPIPDTQVTAATASAIATGKTDVSGLYRISLPPRSRNQPVMLRFEHPGYVNLELTAPADLLVVARMESSAPVQTPSQQRAETVIANPRIRYSVKSTNATNIGSVVTPFEVTNTGDEPCGNHPPCSPDGRWKATEKWYSFDAGVGNEFRNVRLSCIAGPCPFTKIETETQSDEGRWLKVHIRNWSDPATYLFEAEVSQTRVIDVIRQSYPVILGSTMSFTLPSGAEGPSIEGEMNGADIVFPLGPDLILTWATCTMKASPGQGQLYRCELKAGYRFGSHN